MSDTIVVSPEMSLPIQVSPPTPPPDSCPALSGGIVAPCNPLYTCARLNYNRSIIKSPSLLIFCYSTYDVILAISYAQQKKIPFRIRSGRHDYEVNSNLDDGLVIDISPINFIHIDPLSCTVKMGAGITSGAMYKILAQSGFTIPSGSCNDVGLGSLTSVGGVGFLSRALGLACDNLLEVELVNANAELLLANFTTHSDLFWALRGGLSANFGIVTALTYKLTPITFASLYEICWHSHYAPIIINYWQHFAPTTDNRLSSVLSFSKDERGCITISSSGTFLGSKVELMQLLAGLINLVPTLSVTIKTLSYEQVVDSLGTDCIGPNKFKGTGTYIYEPLSAQSIETLIRVLTAAPYTASYYFRFISLNGYIATISPHETAYVHRDALFLLEIKTIWVDSTHQDLNISYTNHIKELLDTMGKGTYRGFTNFDLIDWENQYYGTNYPRLQAVKKNYDPENFFNFPQSIVPSST